ncbi:MAG: T9SS type A sorting domain-containing protein, partial [candidate division Zixibacteria bacterium]|nr:T9SS type A sorting domain-containing protein [candidate division Zixibacteria bacterium]
LATATIINIPDDYGTIQEGIYASSDGDTVLVQPGTYFENINFNGHSIVLGSLFLTTEDTSYISTTIIDGDSLANVVRFENHEDSTTMITGFTIQHGGGRRTGGGIYCSDSNPQICNNIIRDNSSTRWGGGIYAGGGESYEILNNIIMENYSRDGGGICTGGSSEYAHIKGNIITFNRAVSGGGILCKYTTPKIEDNIIQNNSADFGGGIRIGWQANTSITNNVITGNFADSCGGGIYSFYPVSAIINGNSITDNYSWGAGGGIMCAAGGTAIIINNSIECNLSSTGAGIYCLSDNVSILENNIYNNHSPFGAGIYCGSSDPTIKRNNIYNNYGVLRGAGIYCNEYANPAITHNVIYSNYGNGICCFLSDPVIFNNVIASNYSMETGGIYCWASSPQIMNSIIWANGDSGGTEILLEEGSDPYITFCDIQGGWEGEGNLDVDPLFRDPVNGDYHLMATYCDDPFDSPLIDAGNPDYGDTLLDCDWGLGTEICDMGAFSGEGIPTDVPEIVVSSLPYQTSLSQNYPNPFNPVTTIEYALPHQSEVRLDVYNLLGQRVETLVDNIQKLGNYSISWNASGFSSGIYFYRLTSGDKTYTKRMTLLK